MKILRKYERETQIATADDYIGIVLVKRKNDYVTWAYTRTERQTDVETFSRYWGHYIKGRKTAEKDFNARVNNLRG